MILLKKTTYFFAIVSALVGLAQFAHGLFPVRTQEVQLEAKPYCDQGKRHIEDDINMDVSYFFKINGHHFSVPERIYHSFEEKDMLTMQRSRLDGRILNLSSDEKKYSLTYHRSFLPFWVSIWLYFIPLVVFVSETTQTHAWALRLFLFLSLISTATFIWSIIMGDSVLVNEATLTYPEVINY